MLLTKRLQRIIETHGMTGFEPVLSESNLNGITSRLSGRDLTISIIFFQLFMFADISQRNINGFLISWAWIKAEEVIYKMSTFIHTHILHSETCDYPYHGTHLLLFEILKKNLWFSKYRLYHSIILYDNSKTNN